MRFRTVNLGLQGGGAHGAFTWGVLDRLLTEEGVRIGGVSGTSAGAMNAVVLADGLRRGGNAEGRRALAKFWQAVGRLPGLASVSNPLLRRARNEWHLDGSPAYIFFDLMSRVWSPYVVNPMNYNPLRELLAELVDFAALRGPDAVRTIVCATNARTGQRRTFDNDSLSVDAILASACLPFLFPAIEIDGDAFWDGGYTGNPAIYPLYVQTEANDFLLVNINPTVRAELARNARDIINRVNEISFNSTFILELRAFAFVQQLVRDEGIQSSRLRQLRFHAIEANAELASLGASSKLNNEPAFLDHLFSIGRHTADVWLSRHLDDIGERSTFDLVSLAEMRGQETDGSMVVP